MIFFVTIKAQQFGEFKEKLKLLGEVKEQPGESRAQKEQMALKIELIRKQDHPENSDSSFHARNKVTQQKTAANYVQAFFSAPPFTAPRNHAREFSVFPD